MGARERADDQTRSTDGQKTYQRQGGIADYSQFRRNARWAAQGTQKAVAEARKAAKASA